MILCVAIKMTVDGKPVVIPGYRHANCFELLSELHVTYSRDNVVDGFIDNNGNFLDRYKAFSHAVECGQISSTTMDCKRDKFEVQLYSEDLY